MSNNDVGRGNTNSFFEMPDRVTLSDIFEYQPIVEFMFGGAVNYNALINIPLLRGCEDGESILFGGKMLPMRGVRYTDLAPHVVNNRMFVIVPASTFLQNDLLVGLKVCVKYPHTVIDLTEDDIVEALDVGTPIITSEVINTNYWIKGAVFPYSYFLICNMGNGEFKLIVPLNEYPTTKKPDVKIKGVRLIHSNRPLEMVIRGLSEAMEPPFTVPNRYYTVELRVRESCGWLASPDYFYFDNWLAKELFLMLVNKHKVYDKHGETAVATSLDSVLKKPDSESESTQQVARLLSDFDSDGDGRASLCLLLKDFEETK